MALGKKGVAATILGIILIIIIIIWLFYTLSKECRSDAECGEEKYCGYDFKCHKMPVIEKVVSQTKVDLKMPALILGGGYSSGSDYFKEKKNKVGELLSIRFFNNSFNEVG